MESLDFVNEAFTKAINNYLAYKNSQNGVEFNSFFVVVVRLLALIYDELDIVGPYELTREKSLFDNLTKYGYKREKLDEFFSKLDSFYHEENEKDFLDIQKYLVDMFTLKKLSINVSDDEIRLFRNLLFTPYSDNQIIVAYNFKMTSSPFEVLDYFKNQLLINKKVTNVKEKEFLNIDAYEILNYSMEDINAMDADALDSLNKKVYSYFDINHNAINKDYLLNKAVFDYLHPKASLSTGNGYVDILLILALVATCGFLLVLITVFIL